MSGAVVFRHVPTESLNASNSVRFDGFVESRFDCRSTLRYLGLSSWHVGHFQARETVRCRLHQKDEVRAVLGDEVVEACVTVLAWRKRTVVVQMLSSSIAVLERLPGSCS